MPKQLVSKQVVSKNWCIQQCQTEMMFQNISLLKTWGGFLIVLRSTDYDVISHPCVPLTIWGVCCCDGSDEITGEMEGDVWEFTQRRPSSRYQLAVIIDDRLYQLIHSHRATALMLQTQQIEISGCIQQSCPD